MYEAVGRSQKLGLLCGKMAGLLFAGILLFYALPAQAQLVGADTVPGSPCGAKGAVRMTANPAGPGAYILTCDGDSGQWVATINTASPTADEQAANKEYADNSVAENIPLCEDDAAGLCLLDASRASSDPQFVADNIAGGANILGVTGNIQGSCLAIGELCPDGTAYIGYHPTLLVPLYIPVTDQAQRIGWKTTAGMNDIANDSDDDGRANSDQISNSATFPAFKACKDLTFGGHSDWYLPSIVEVYYLLAVRKTVEARGNITPLLDDYYWSSTEATAEGDDFAAASNYNYGGTQARRDKTHQGSVRCMRR